MMSPGLRALCTNTTSGICARSCIVRDMLISGVMPLPPDKNIYFGAGCRAAQKSPLGPATGTRMPARRVACSQGVTSPAGTRLLVICTRSGRVGGEAMV